MPVDIARAHALTRWWHGRQERIATGNGHGGRYTPAAAIDRLFTAVHEPHSVCTVNARALFESDAARDVAVMALTIRDPTSGRLVVDEYERRHVTATAQSGPRSQPVHARRRSSGS